jgi:hypothetical protein
MNLFEYQIRRAKENESIDRIMGYAWLHAVHISNKNTRNPILQHLHWIEWQQRTREKVKRISADKIQNQNYALEL